MIPIVTDHRDGYPSEYTLKEFDKKFLSICSEHRRKGRALAFAFILWDQRSPEIYKVLEDQHYWKALDTISGSNLSVFSFHCHPPLQREGTSLDSSSNLVNYITEIKAPDTPKRDIFVSRYFEGSENFGLPCILFFQVEEKSVSDSMIIRLAPTGIEQAFGELRDVIDTAVSAVKNMPDDNRKNSEKIFQLMKADLTDRHYSILAKKMTNKALRWKEIVTFVLGVAAGGSLG